MTHRAAPETLPRADSHRRGVRPPLLLCARAQDPFWDLVMQGFRSGAACLGFDAVFLAPPHHDAREQLALLEEATPLSYSGLAVVAAELGLLGSAVRRWVELGRPVVTVDLDDPEIPRDVLVGSAPVAQQGQMAGAELVRRLREQDKVGPVLILGGPREARGAREKREAISAELAGAGFGPVEVAYDEGSPESAAEAFARLLDRRRWAAVAGVWGYHSGVIARTLQARVSRSHRPIVVGFDLLDETRMALRSGWVDAVVWFDEQRMGRLAAATLGILVAYGQEDGLRLLGMYDVPRERRILRLDCQVVDAAALASMERGAELPP